MVSPSKPYSTNYDGTAPPPPRSSPRTTFDELIRRELRVEDPTNPEQVSQALLSRYKHSSAAKGITQEATGTPSVIDITATPVAESTTSSSKELQQAIDDVEHDFRELLQNSLLKDVMPELEGWQRAVRFAINEGTAAARMSLDTRQRDKSFGIRRTLGDYARLARLVGALTPSLSQTYRKLAQSLDEVAAVLLVMMGEALASVGFSGGRFLLQVPYTELKVRRDAAIYALRQLISSTEDTYDPNNWHRGINAYRQLFNVLETRGEGDLRVLLLETELATIMDELIQRAEQGQSDGLRALGATAQIDLERLRRLVIVGKNAVNPLSPALITFLDTLLLFVQAFDSSGGFRLLKIARPPILFYGLYGVSGLDNAERALLDLIEHRGRIAEQLDCFLSCDCSQSKVEQQVLLDKLLYDIDRAIDLYAVSSAKGSTPEQRAAAYGYLITAALNNERWSCQFRTLLNEHLTGELDDVSIILRTNYEVTPPESYSISASLSEAVKQELCIQKTAERQWENLVRTMAPSCVDFNNLFGENGVIATVIKSALRTEFDISSADCDLLTLGIPEHIDASTQLQAFNQTIDNDSLTSAALSDLEQTTLRNILRILQAPNLEEQIEQIKRLLPHPNETTSRSIESQGTGEEQGGQDTTE